MTELFDPRPFIAAAPWRFAKTMASIPHEYVVEGKVPDPDGFEAFLAHITEHGYRARWRHLPANSYLELDGWRYWAMPGRGWPKVIIINRERLPGEPLARDRGAAPGQQRAERVAQDVGGVLGRRQLGPGRVLGLLMSHVGTCCIAINMDAAGVEDPELFMECRQEGLADVLAPAGKGRRNAAPQLDAASTR